SDGHCKERRELDQPQMFECQFDHFGPIARKEFQQIHDILVPCSGGRSLPWKGPPSALIERHYSRYNWLAAMAGLSAPRQILTCAKRRQIFGDDWFRRAQKLLRRVHAHQAARLKEPNAAGEPQGLAQVVRHKHNGLLEAPLKLEELTLDFRARNGAEGDKRLVSH